LDAAVFQLQSGTIHLADHVQVRSWTIVKSAGELIVGSHTVFGYGSAVHCAEQVDIGDRVVVAERATVIDSDHLMDGSDEYFMDRPLKASAVTIGPNTLLGVGSATMRGAHVGRNAAVGAGSVVLAGEYPDGWLLVGSPAKATKSLGEGDTDAPATAAVPTTERTS
jgi:acetyltransferase-like isoleucine patch superfamily enzyme